MALYKVTKPNQPTFGKHDLYRSLAAAKRKAEKIGGTVITIA